ncbi:hypothetical protein SCOR_34865 [Sulfidibacter corallicola]
MGTIHGGAPHKTFVATGSESGANPWFRVVRTLAIDRVPVDRLDGSCVWKKPCVVSRTPSGVPRLGRRISPPIDVLGREKQGGKTGVGKDCIQSVQKNIAKIYGKVTKIGRFGDSGRQTSVKKWYEPARSRWKRTAMASRGGAVTIKKGRSVPANLLKLEKGTRSRSDSLSLAIDNADQAHIRAYASRCWRRITNFKREF